MTDQTNAELIAEAKSRAGLCDADTREAVRDTGNIVARLAAALEAAEQRAKRLNAEREQLHAAYVTQVKLSMNANDRAAGFERALDVADQRAAEYAAVVEKVREADAVTSSWDHFGHLVMDILATTPADVLREHEAALIEELATEWEELVQREKPPKRGSLWLRDKARQRREEQDRG